MPRADVLHAARGEHGGRHAQPIGGDAVRQDFSVCLNAFGPSAVVARAIRDAEPCEYPDPRSVAACRAASRVWKRPLDEIVFAAGATELIQAVCFAFIDSNDDVLIAAPAFGEYARASKLCGAAAVDVKLSDDVNDRSEFVARIQSVRPRLVFVGTPISPTGEQLGHDTIREIADACQAVGALLVIDQSYDAFAANPIGFPALPGHGSVAHLRSLTKEHAIAGVRVAFAIAPPAIAEWIDVVRVPWSASSAAQAAAVAALSDDAERHVAQTTVALRDQCVRIAAACRRSGFATSNSSTHYVVIDVGNGTAARAHLLTRGILVRDCTSFGLPRCIRVAARMPDANDELIDALESLTTSLHPQ